MLGDFYGNESRRISPAEIALKQLARLNEDQKKAFFRIKEALDDPSSQRCFFVEGSGGTGMNYYSIFKIIYFIGKSFLYNSVMKWMLAGKPNPEEEAMSLSKDCEQFKKMALRSTDQCTNILFFKYFKLVCF